MGSRHDVLSHPDMFRYPVTCYTIDNVLSKEECEAWIAGLGDTFEPATIQSRTRGQVIDLDYRNCQRAYIDDDQTKLDLLWSRIQPTFPTWDDESYGVPMGLNPRLRVLRYEPGEYFKPHYDANFTWIKGRISQWTLQVYLNDGFEGGETIFYKSDGAASSSYSDPEDPEMALMLKRHLVPKQGTALIFDQALYHEGAAVTKGVKYVVRTDILFPFESDI